MKSRTALLAAGVLGAIGVGLGAFGAHALRAQLTELGTRDRWETAVFYHLTHVLALFGAAIWLRHAVTSKAARRIGWAARFWIAGILLFSGGLYILAIAHDAPLWLKAAVPPLGGTAFMMGWLLVASAGFATDGDE